MGRATRHGSAGLIAAFAMLAAPLTALAAMQEDEPELSEQEADDSDPRLAESEQEEDEQLDILPDRLPPRALEQVAAYTKEKGDGRGFVTAKNLAWTERYVRVAMETRDGVDLRAYYPLVEATAKEWLPPNSRFALSFRNNDGSYRTWSRRDRFAGATIRIAFDQDGSWSLIGKQAQGSDVKPAEPTMNLALGPVIPGAVPRLSSTDRLTILHEFGHALGLSHEHYHAQCQTDLKLDPDPGYVTTVAPGSEAAPRFVPDGQGRSPGVYKAMAGSPNFWEMRSAEFNYDWAAYSRETGLRMENILRGAGAPRSTADRVGFVQSAMIDRSSVMLYPIPSFLLKSGRNSACRFVAQGSGVNLSAMDREAFASLYPPR
jgi:hypothetical protein